MVSTIAGGRGGWAAGGFCAWSDAAAPSKTISERFIDGLRGGVRPIYALDGRPLSDQDRRRLPVDHGRAAVLDFPPPVIGGEGSCLVGVSERRVARHVDGAERGKSLAQAILRRAEELDQGQPLRIGDVVEPLDGRFVREDDASVTRSDTDRSGLGLGAARSENDCGDEKHCGAEHTYRTPPLTAELHSGMAKAEAAEILRVAGHDVRITHPDKPYFTKEAKLSKLDVVKYFLSVAPGAIQGIRNRPIVLKRFVNGAETEPFYQKRAPDKLPEFLRTVTLSFPSGRTAHEIVVDAAAGLTWVVNLGCIELHPHAVSAADLDHPDELRIDLDPIPGLEWKDVRAGAMEAKALLEELGLRGWPKTSGSRGMHVNARIHPQWSFSDVRRAALAFSREIERRSPKLASSKWWEEERRGVFLDYNQNAKGRTACSAYSIRPLPGARVSTNRIRRA